MNQFNRFTYSRNKRKTLPDQQRAKWAEEHSDVVQWVQSNKNNDFAVSLSGRLSAYGTLTEPQVLAVKRILERSRQRAAQRAQDDLVRTAQGGAEAPTLNVAPLVAAFDAARERGVARPKIHIGDLRITPAPAHGANPGAIYVTHNDVYLGKIVEGRWMPVHKIDASVEAEFLKIARDPLAEAKAFGQRTGVCAICRRLLTNHASVDAGIGPICQEKFGW